MTQTTQEKLAKIREALAECDEAMGYMSEYDIPVLLPSKVESAIYLITEIEQELLFANHSVGEAKLIIEGLENKLKSKWDNEIEAIKTGIKQARDAFLANPDDFLDKLSDDDLVAFIHDELHKLKPKEINVGKICIAYNTVLLNQPEDCRNQVLAMKAAIAEIERQKNER